MTDQTLSTDAPAPDAHNQPHAESALVCGGQIYQVHDLTPGDLITMIRTAEADGTTLELKVSLLGPERENYSAGILFLPSARSAAVTVLQRLRMVDPEVGSHATPDVKTH